VISWFPAFAFKSNLYRYVLGRSPTLRGALLGLHALTLAAYAPNNAAPGSGNGAGEVDADGTPTKAAAAAATAGLLASMVGLYKLNMVEFSRPIAAA
jgi:hypothetical protein